MQPINFLKNEKERAYEISQRQGVLGRALFSGWEKTVSDCHDKSVAEANTRLRLMVDRLKWGGFNLSILDNEKITDYCESRAGRALLFLARFPDDMCADDVQVKIEEAGRLLEHGLLLDLPEDEEKRLKALRAIYVRICDPVWWRRKLKRVQKRTVEGIARDMGMVQKRKGGYCSYISLFNQRKQNERNQKLLDSMKAENQEGQSFYLSELQDKSISNPEIRRAELMTRIRGFEILADRQNHVAAFWTITCPSKYHAFHSYGEQNDKYKGASVLDGQQYLVRMWAGFRAWLKRNEIDGYGFRVSSPHLRG